MNPLTKEMMEDVFLSVISSIKGRKKEVITKLNEIKPLSHKVESLEWRYRLDGYIKGLLAAGILDKEDYKKTYTRIYPDREINDSENERPGRNHTFTVIIERSSKEKYTFNVAAMNAVDAYVQLTKRVAYKAIPDIERVYVYDGLYIEQTAEQKLLRQFDSSELINVATYL